MNIGDKAPEILGKDEQGRDIRLSDYKGRKLVLYFYPKDNTSGCTKQAQLFTELYEEFAAKNAVVVGVSCNSVASHKKFAESKDLKQTLMADENAEMVKLYDVWHEKKMAGRTYMGIVRSTYIIDETGVITHAFPNVKAAVNPGEMLKLV